MKNFEIRDIFSAERLRALHSESASSSRKPASSSSKDSLKRSMGELLSEIVSSLSPDSAHGPLEGDLVDHKILH